MLFLREGLPKPFQQPTKGPAAGRKVVLTVAILCILQGCCETNQDDVLGKVYSSLVQGNGGGSGNNGDDWGGGGSPADAEYITAIIGESVVFNCHVEFPDGYPVPYIVQWDKKGVEIPIHIWYDGYPTHTGRDYEGRVDRVNPNSSYGHASLNVTMIRENDRGWYNCRVFFLNRNPNKNITGSWYHLDVHAPPRFVHTSDDVVYTKVGKNVVLHCRAEGTPAPEIVWYKESDAVQPSASIQIVNDGTELRINQIRSDDIGDYTCIARNGEGKIHHVVKVLIAGSAFIINPPTNLTKVEGEKVIFPCEWRALPSNATVVWLRDGKPVRQIPNLESRVETPAEGALIINPVSSDDSGFYECRVSNGIGGTQNGVAYLNVEYPAQVTYTPTVQYLPHMLSGVVRCYIMANPPIQFVMWTRDKHLLEPYEEEGFAVMNNGSLLIDSVKDSHQGQYTCTPYNVHGTKGASLQMQVIVKEPPKFEITPDAMYQSKLGATLEIPCRASAPNGTTTPLIAWIRKDGRPLPRDRVRVQDGVLSIDNVHEADFGEYECVASNEVATLVAPTKIYVEGAPPQAPYNVTGTPAIFTVTLTWMPGFAPDPSMQRHVVRYRLQGQNTWETLHVTPPGSSRIVIRNLIPGKTYQFQVIGSGPHGLGEPSETVNITTLGVVPTILVNVTDVDPTIPGSSPSTSAKTTVPGEIHDYSVLVYPTDEFGSTFVPILLRPQGPSPGAPWNVTIVDAPKQYSTVITWMPPLHDEVAVAWYRVDYRTAQEQFKPLSKEPILPPTNSYTARRIKADKYIFRVSACSVATKCTESEELAFQVPERDVQKAIVAGIVGGILFFIVAIILAVCAVKICNRRKRRKQEKAYNMVACRLTDARNGGQIPVQPQIPPSATHTLKKNGVDLARVVTSSAKSAYQSVGRAVGRFIIHLLDLRLRRHAVIMTTRSRPPSITSITLSLGAGTGRPLATRLRPSSPSTSPLGPRRSRRSIDVVDETSSDDGGFLAPRPLRYFPRGRRRFDLVLPGTYVPSSSLLRSSDNFPIPRPLASSPVPYRHSRSRSASSTYFNPADLTQFSTVPRFPVLVQVHQPPYMWGTATTGRHYHPVQYRHGDVVDYHPTPPPWELERIRDNLARDLDYLERQVPQFFKHQRQQLHALEQQSSSSSRFHESSSGFQSGSKIGTANNTSGSTTFPSSSGLSSSGGGLPGGAEVLLRPIALPDEPAPVQTLYAPSSPFPIVPFRSVPPRTYENWPRREPTPPIYAMARSPSFDVDLATSSGMSPITTTTIPAAEPSPSTRTLMDMSVDDPYEFDPVIPDTSPEIGHSSHHPSGTTSTSSSTSRFKRTKEKYENMEARVAAMKEEFFEYRRRQKKRMESAC